MSDILLDFPIKAAPDRVFRAVSTPGGLDRWWTLRSEGKPGPGAEYRLYFGPRYDWRARVTNYTPDAGFELEMIGADADWVGTRVGFLLERRGEATWVRFHHTGWQGANEHYRVSCNCWALYLRILRRYLEHGESVPYEDRLDA
jgi:uncharacterized protein YndB with AHSA1/START domain